ncbi:MAG: hypothetical protein ACP5PQ_02240 [Thermoproteota archaeon]
MRQGDSLEAVNLRGKNGSPSHIEKLLDVLMFNGVNLVAERV